jgi:DNA polymerase I
MPVDTFSSETQKAFSGSHLWKEWMTERRLYQATTLSDLREFFQRGRSFNRISIDFETKDLSRTWESVCGFCLAFTEKEGIYVPIKHVNYPEANLDPAQTWQMLLDEIKNRLVVVYNWEFEGTILRTKGVYRDTTLSHLNDAMVYRWLYDSDKKQFNLKDAAFEICGQEMNLIHEVPGIRTGKRSKEIDFSLSDPREATLYAAADPVFSLAVLDICKPEVDREQGFIANLEHTLLGTLGRMTENRITIDRAFLQQARLDLSRWIEHTALDIYAKLGEEIDLNSTKEVSRVLKKLGVPLKKTSNVKQENYETNAKALKPLAKEHPIVDDILFYRSIVKERSTYIDPLLKATSEDSPSVIFRFVSIGAPTGRFSSGGVDEGDSMYAPMNPQAITSASDYKKAKVRRVVIQGLQLRS